MPSKFEAFGIVFVESLINGVPVIAKNSFEMKNIIRHGENGFLIDENSVDELVKYMERIMTADKIFHIVNEEKEQIRNKYTWGNVARLMYENIVK